MSVNIIDTLKPKNGLDFPAVEAVDVAVEGYTSLADAVTHFATQSAIDAITATLNTKADTSALTEATTNLQNQIEQIVISASAESVVAPEVAAARVGTNGTSYQTLKARLDAENAALKDDLGEITEYGNLVLGKIEHASVNSLGEITTEPLCDLWYAQVEQGQTYAITTDESTIILGYYDELPYSGLRSYDSQRVITEAGVYTVTAPITGYIAFRSLTGYEYAQIEKGTTKTPYKNYVITAKDYYARSRFSSIETKVADLDTETSQKFASIEDDMEAIQEKVGFRTALYNGLEKTDTYELYAHATRYYSICDATAGSTINKLSVLAGDGVIIRLLLFYKSDNHYYIENLIRLGNGTGDFVEYTINYTLTHDCTLALNAFGYAVASSGNVPQIISDVTSASQPGTELLSIEDGRAPLDYTCKVTVTDNSELSQLEDRVSIIEDQVETITDASTFASDIAMFENIGFCGDSYMAGMVVLSENPTVTALNQKLCWGKILERTHGVNASIFAKGGVRASDYISDTDCLPALLAASAQQLYVISLGHNDAYFRTSVSSFKASYESILDSIIGHAPNAKIILCRQSRGYGDLNNGPELNEAISEIGEDYGLPVLDPEDDIYLSSSIYTNTMVHRHPTFAGYAGMAKAFDRQFAKATVDYANYFKDYTGLPAE